jgi:hypothetical protein
MVSKAFKGVREKFRARLPLDFFSTLFVSFLSLESALKQLEGEVFWVGVCAKNWVGGGCLYRPKGVADRPSGGSGRPHLASTRVPSPPSISCCLPTLEKVPCEWEKKVLVDEVIR